MSADDQTAEASDRTDGRDQNARSVRGRLAGVRRRLEVVRRSRRRRTAALIAAALLGLAAAWLHWIGLVLAGAAIGLVSWSLPRAMLTAGGFGLVVLVAFALATGPDVATLAATTPIVYVAVAAAIGLPLFGSLVRGIV